MNECTTELMPNTPKQPSVEKKQPILKFVSPGKDRMKVDNHTITFGKSPLADVRVDGFFVEKIHGYIGKSDASHFILNLGRSKIIKVNGKKIKRHALRSGDLVQIGKISFIYFQ